MQNSNESPEELARLVNARRRDRPFPHFVAQRSFRPDVADAAHAWLDAHAPWRRHVTDFFDQFECSMLHMQLPPLLQDGLVSPTTLRSLRRQVEALFSVSLADVYTVTAHRLVAGQGIGVHTDRPLPGYEGYRMVVHLGPACEDSSGGHLMFFHDDDIDALACGFRGVHNSAVGFELSERSFHAVGELSSGVRYTLVYSFWRADCRDIESSGVRIEELERARPGRKDLSLAGHAIAGRTLDELLQVLVAAGAACTPKPEYALLPDLTQTYDLLRLWRRSDDVCLAGLFHGVYGSAWSRHRLIAPDQRERVREVIGRRAEELVFAGCAADYESLKRALRQGDPKLIEDRWRRAPLGIDEDTMVAIATSIMAHRVALHSRKRPSDEEWADERELLALVEPRLDPQLREQLRKVYGANS